MKSAGTKIEHLTRLLTMIKELKIHSAVHGELGY
jgi:hypothetical protein